MAYSSFSAATRVQSLSRIQKQPPLYDALVVGGGIVGVGAARELALRGIQTLLVEKNDFASGTSSRSSKLIHGGLRYLEMLDFGLVFESLSERHWLLKTNPHLVEPLEFVLPAYQKDLAPPRARSGALLGLGLWIYDALSLFRTPFFHGWYDPRRLAQKFPGLRSKGLKGGYFYADAMMLDDELVLECALDAKQQGAELLNYVGVVRVSDKIKAESGPDYYEVELADQLNPQNPHFIVRTKEVIGCVGPWTERFGNLVVGGAKKKLKPSKGVHLIFPWKRFPVESCLVMYAPDGRVIFIIPRKDLGAGAEMVIMGTTDSPEAGDPGDALTTEADVQYLLAVLTEYFPDLGLGPNDIVNTYAGVRPLLDDGAETEAKTSREHDIWRNDTGVIFVAGGKYTTFRPMSQEIVDFAFPQSRNTPGGQKSESLSRLPLSDPQEYRARFSGKPLWGRFTDGWVKWKLEHHAPCNFEDVVLRRLPLWMAGTEIKDSLLRDILKICKDHFKWTDQEAEVQLQLVKTKLKEGMSWRA